MSLKEVGSRSERQRARPDPSEMEERDQIQIKRNSIISNKVE